MPTRPAYDPIRSRLAHLIEREHEDMAGLSRMLGRPPGWLGRYVREGTPKQLPDRERETLAGYFRVYPVDLSARDLRAWRAEQARR